MNAPLDPGRRALLKTGGALVVGFTLPAAALGPARAQAPPPVGPDLKQVDTWLAIHEDNTVTLYLGFVELGQGTTTALPQVAAEELDIGLDQIHLVQHETNLTPNQGGTYSSASIARGSPQVRAAAAEARAALLMLASDRLGAPVDKLQVSRGVVSVTGSPKSKVSYGALVRGKRMQLTVSGKAKVKSPDDYKVVGKAPPRRDLPAKARGDYAYVQHVRLPGMLHGRVVRPRGQRAYGAGAKVLAVDEASIAATGAKVVRRKDFVGVVASREWDAVKAARLLKVTWDDAPTLPPFDQMHARMQSGPTQDQVVLKVGDADKALQAGGRIVTLTGYGPYQSHAPFAPNCAVADVKADGAHVVCSSQDIYNCRTGLARILGLPAEHIRVQFASGAGTYGHSCYDDVAQAAAIMSQLAGAPVRVQFMRADEHGWDTYGPAHVGKATVAAGEDGRITGYLYEGWQHDWSLTEVSDQLATGAEPAEWAVFPSDQVALATCGGQYAIADRKLVNHRVPGGGWLRGAWLRSPLDLSCAFVSEQAVDHLAFQLGLDPIEFRTRNISDPRWQGVLDAVRQASGWTPRAAGVKGSGGSIVRGRGVGLGTHLQSWGACVAEVEVDKASGKVRILKLAGAIDAGLAVNPGIVEAQITGQLVQLTGRMLLEEVTFDEKGVTSLDWNGYRVARFEDCPQITPVVVQRLHEPSMGAGEECMAAGAAAVANAFFDATGVRMDRYPFTPERVKAALSKGPTA
ncbi:MAG: molybdopterin cofactor-binding domain-containing protein [Caulobacteraceae bacterium]